MTPRMLGRVAIALVVVLVLWGASRLLSRRTDSVLGGWSIPNVSAGDVDSVRVDRAGATTLLIHRQGTWTANGWPTNSESVDGLFRALHDTSRAELVGESKAVHDRLGVDSATGMRMRVYGKGRPAIDLTIGKTGDSYPSAYARRTAELQTYMLRSEIGDVARRATDDWRDRKIGGYIPLDSITGFDVDLGRKSYAIRQIPGSQWQFVGGKPADSARVVAHVAHYANIMATGFATAAQVDSMKRRTPTRHLVVRNGNHTMTELWFDSTAAGFLVKRARDSVIYKMETWGVSDLTPLDSTLRPASAQPLLPQVVPPRAKAPAKAPSKRSTPPAPTKR